MSLPRTIFSEEHDQFRDSVRRFMATEVSPNVERYETQQFIDREVWLKGGEAGFDEFATAVHDLGDGSGGRRNPKILLFKQHFISSF